mgnify:CR=1 FL=1
MAIRKPIPKTQKELSIAQQSPSSERYGNPNIPLPSNENETGINFNRSEKLSWTGDTTKPFSIGIKDLDEAVFYYFQNVIKPFVYQYGSFQRAYNPKNFYNNFDAINNAIPAKQFYAVAVPDFVNIEYSCLIQTYYMEQLNKIIESCEYASDAYWGNPERFKFRAFIDSFSTETSLTKGKDRLVKGTFNIRLRGYIIPDTIQKDLNSINKYNTKSKFIISMETTSNDAIFIQGVTKTNDGRTRTLNKDEGGLSDIYDMKSGKELKL